MITSRHYLEGEERFGDTGDLPDPPDNLEFLDLFTSEQQEQIALRFEVGITKHNLAMRALYERSAEYNRNQAREAELRAARQGRAVAARFNPVLRERPSEAFLARHRADNSGTGR